MRKRERVGFKNAVFSYIISSVYFAITWIERDKRRFMFYHIKRELCVFLIYTWNMRNMLRLVKIRFSVNSRAKTTTNRPFFLRCRWQRRLRREGIVLYTFNRLMRRSYFHLDVVYAHVQRLPPQTRTYFITNSSSSTNTHMNLYAFVVGIRAQWTSIPTNINIHTYTYIRLTTRFSFHLILVAWMLVL